MAIAWQEVKDLVDGVSSRIYKHEFETTAGYALCFFGHFVFLPFFFFYFSLAFKFCFLSLFG